MNALSIRCIKAAFGYLALGISLGAVFAWDRAVGAQLRPLHAELNMWGWLPLLIYGMGYHMLPRFTGHQLRSPRVANLQSLLAIAGVALASVGWIFTLSMPGLAPIFLLGGGALQLAAVALFAALIGDLLLRA